MRQFRVGDRIIKLNEKDYKMLLGRFDLTNCDGLYYYYIRRPCICRIHDNCSVCPIKGCGGILADLGLQHYHLNLGIASVGWEKVDNVKARVEVAAIHKFLLSLDKI